MEYLGWNAKIIVGYRGTNDLSIAMERGEIDMHTTSNMFIVNKLMDTGRFRIIAQSGSHIGGKFVERPEFPEFRCWRMSSGSGSRTRSFFVSVRVLAGVRGDGEVDRTARRDAGGHRRGLSRGVREDDCRPRVHRPHHRRRR